MRCWTELLVGVAICGLLSLSWPAVAVADPITDKIEKERKALDQLKDQIEETRKQADAAGKKRESLLQGFRHSTNAWCTTDKRIRKLAESCGRKTKRSRLSIHNYPGCVLVYENVGTRFWLGFGFSTWRDGLDIGKPCSLRTRTVISRAGSSISQPYPNGTLPSWARFEPI